MKGVEESLFSSIHKNCGLPWLCEYTKKSSLCHILNWWIVWSVNYILIKSVHFQVDKGIARWLQRKIKAVSERQQIVAFFFFFSFWPYIKRFHSFSSWNLQRARGFIKLWKIFINILSECKRNSKELMHSLKRLLKWMTWNNYIYLPKFHNLEKWQLKKQLYSFIWPTGVIKSRRCQ